MQEEKKLHTEKGRKLKNVSKKNLRTMQKTRKHHPMREKARIVKYGTKGFGRNIWLSTAATVVMSITLIILFVTVVASVILTNTADMMKDKIDITIYLKPNTSEETLAELSEIIEKDPNTKSVDTSTSEVEYEKFLADHWFESEYSAHINSIFAYRRGYEWRTEYWRELVELPFERLKLPAPIDYDKVLAAHYGDWHELIVTHSHFATHSADISYRDYFKQIKSQSKFAAV